MKDIHEYARSEMIKGDIIPGFIILIQGSTHRSVQGYLYKEDRGRLFFLHDDEEFNGNSPSNYIESISYLYSWVLMKGIPDHQPSSFIVTDPDFLLNRLIKLNIEVQQKLKAIEGRKTNFPEGIQKSLSI